MVVVMDGLELAGTVVMRVARKDDGGNPEESGKVAATKFICRFTEARCKLYGTVGSDAK